MTLRMERYPTRESWLAGRGLGASDVAAVLGVSPYRSAWDVWMSATKRARPTPETLDQRRGKALQRAVLDYYAMGGATLIREPIVGGWLARRGHLTASPDALVMDGPELIGGAEVKTDRHGYHWGPTQEIPEWSAEAAEVVRTDYAIQAYVQTHVLDVPWVDLVVMTPFFDVRTYRIHRDSELEERLVETTARWWRDHVVADVPPEVDGSEGALAYLVTRLLPERFRARPATPEEEALVAELSELSAEAQSVEAREALVKARLVEAARDTSKIEAPAGSVSVSTVKGRRSTDWTAVRKAHPEIEPTIKAHTSVGETSCSFRFTARS